MFASSSLDAVATLCLLSGACLGHLAIWVGHYNWWYGFALDRTVNKLVRLFSVLMVVSLPVALVLLVSWDPTVLFARAASASWLWIPASYLALCWIVGFLVFPAITLGRCLRRTPAILSSNHTRTVDVAAELGFKPIGDAKHRHLAALPFNEVFKVDFSEKTFHFPQLPAALDGLTILHLSDLHFTGTPSRPFFHRVMDVCAAWEPDLVAFTGDLVDSDLHRRWIVPVLGRLRWRIAAFAILGNHDYWWQPVLVRRRLRRLGMNVLGNTWQQVEVRGQPLVVIGHEGPWFLPAPDVSACPEGVFRICLSHTPDNLPWARRHGIDLMLSGHNHGGQVRLPMVGSVFVPSRYGRRYDCGIFHEAPTLLHVSRGLGGEHPLRLNCRPEVTKIILER